MLLQQPPPPRQRSQWCRPGDAGGTSSPVGLCGGKVLVEMVVSLFTKKMPFCTRKAARFEAAPEQPQPWRTGSGLRNAARAGQSTGCLPSPADIPRVSPTCETSRKCSGTQNTFLAGDSSDYTQGTRGAAPRRAVLENTLRTAETPRS